jgi:hypothetical protein
VVKRDGAAANEVTTRIGIRTIRFDPDKGFFLNPGAIIGLNNGDPRSHEPEKENQHTVFHRLAQVIL